MSQAVESLWSPEIRSAAQTPLSILRIQADELVKQTSGVLVGDVHQWVDEDDKIKLALEIVVPELDRSRFRVLSVQHDRLMPYPAVLDAEIFRHKGLAGVMAATTAIMGEGKKPDNRAEGDAEFRDLVKKVLNSSPVKALATSLIARVTDLRNAWSSDVSPSPPPPPEGSRQ